MKNNLLLLTLFIGVLFVADRIFYQKTEEPFRQGVNAYKEGNFKIALEKLIPYAVQGNIIAKNIVGEIYAFGLGVPTNEKEAEKWFSCEGVDNCVPGKSEYATSIEFSQGIIIEKNTEKARYWLNLSVEKGYKP